MTFKKQGYIGRELEKAVRESLAYFPVTSKLSRSPKAQRGLSESLALLNLIAVGLRSRGGCVVVLKLRRSIRC